MRAQKCVLCAVTLSAAMAFGAAAMADDLPKEGTSNVTFSGFGRLRQRQWARSDGSPPMT
jgi:hypothetical protein